MTQGTVAVPLLSVAFLCEEADDVEKGSVPMGGAPHSADSEFDEFVRSHELGLRRALVSAYGPEVGRDALADVLAWAWLNWSFVRNVANPSGYLYRSALRVASRMHKREARENASGAPVGMYTESPAVEPRLAPALATLSDRQRAAVLLVHGYGYTQEEAAQLLGCTPSIIRNHLAPGLARLRRQLGVLDAD